MSKDSGIGAFLLVDEHQLTNDVGSVPRIACPAGQLDVTGLDKGAHERISGIRDGMIDFAPFFNPSAGQAHAALSPLPRTDRIVTYGHRDSQGVPAASLVSKQVNYDATRGADGAFTFATATTGNRFGLEWGLVLTDDGITVSVTPEDLGSLDGGGETTFGLQAYLHVLAFTGTGPATVTIEDSADDAAFAALSPAFTAFSAVGSERIAVTGTVRQYLRASIAGTYDSMTILVNVNRNPVAVAF